MNTDTLPIWLVWSHEHNAWWRPNSAGYTHHIEAAGLYRKAEADEICRQRGPKRFDEDPPHEVAVIAPAAARALRIAVDALRRIAKPALGGKFAQYEAQDALAAIAKEFQP